MSDYIELKLYSDLYYWRQESTFLFVPWVDHYLGYLGRKDAFIAKA